MRPSFNIIVNSCTALGPCAVALISKFLYADSLERVLLTGDLYIIVTSEVPRSRFKFFFLININISNNNKNQKIIFVGEGGP